MFANLCLVSSVVRQSEICRTEKRQKESNGTTNSDSKFVFSLRHLSVLLIDPMA